MDRRDLLKRSLAAVGGLGFVISTAIILGKLKARANSFLNYIYPVVGAASSLLIILSLLPFEITLIQAETETASVKATLESSAVLT